MGHMKKNTKKSGAVTDKKNQKNQTDPDIEKMPSSDTSSKSSETADDSEDIVSPEASGASSDIPESAGTSRDSRKKKFLFQSLSGKRSKNRKKHSKLNIFFTILFVLFAFIAVLVTTSEMWAFSNWSNLEMSEIIFQLTSPLTGTGNNMIGNYMLRCLVPSIIAAAAAVVLLILIRNRHHYRAVAITGFVAALVLTAGAGSYGWQKLDVGTYLENRGKDSTYIEDNYADPSKVQMTFPEKKRNLIYIFMESTEATFTDKKNGGGMPQDYIPELTKLAQQNEDFSGKSKKLNGGYAMSGATWTMGAMFAQTSGLPLQIPLDTNGMSSQTVFFPGITTLGDVLQQQGYSQTLMLGSNATFGGRRLYFTQHGNYNIMDYNYARDNGLIPQGYKVWWGYEDEKLFQFAKDRLTQLGSDTSTPFNFTMLTVDTHFPDGYVCDLCDDEFKGNQYANVFHCSSKQVTAFVKWIQQQPWYDNTTIVISGDHPTMDADFCENVDTDYTRKVYTCYINSAVKNQQPNKRRKFTTFDDFPTTLAALGVKIDGNRLGLGTNLFSKKETLSERDGYHNENVEMQRNSKFMQKASDISSDVATELNRIKNAKVKVSVHVEKNNYVQFTVTGLDKIDDSSIFSYAFIHCRNSNQLTLTEPILNKQSDGTYMIKVPWYKYQNYKDITYMLRIRTTDGTVDLTDAIPYTIA